MNRDLGLDRPASESNWDFLIISGGTTALGATLDAASRGYSAEQVNGLEGRPCVTENLWIESEFPTPDGKPLHPELPYSFEQINYSLAHEMPQSIEDVLSRRIRALTLDSGAAIEIANQIADRMIDQRLLKPEEKTFAVSNFVDQAKHTGL